MVRSLIRAIRGLLTASILWQTGIATGGEDEGYRRLEVDQGMFAGENLSMLEQEKRGIAKELAAHVVNQLAEKVGKGDRGAARLAERLIGLALHLDPRNRSAVVANYQLGRGATPAKIEADYSPEVFSQLLVTRAVLLRKADEAASKVLAGFLFEVAVEVNPRNEDAIYELEMYRLDAEPPKWGLLIPVSAEN